MNNAKARRVAIYARLSQTSEESVSIARQIKSAESYADAYGWQVVGTFTDDGVSASYSRPEERPGWIELMSRADSFDVVIIWKVDRLARRLTDFWETYGQLDKGGVTLVAVEDRLDMTTALGRTFAGVIAGFAEVEAETISKRVAGARSHLIRNGRAVGGKVPYGYWNQPNPDGEGKVTIQNPDTIKYVRGMVERAQAGASLYSIKQWLESSGVVTPTGKDGDWPYSTIERVLRHPILAGMTPFNPGNTKDTDGKKLRTRGSEVLRGEDGLPVVNDSLAIMSVAEWRALVNQLDNRDSPQTTPRKLCQQTSALLSGLVWCGDPRHDEPVRMHRGTVQGRHMYTCPECYQVMSDPDSAVIEEFLRAKGEHVRWTVVEEVHEGGAAVLPEIEHRITELTGKLALCDDEDEADRLAAELKRLRAHRREQRGKTPQVVQKWDDAGLFAKAWRDAETVEEQRAVLDDALERVIVRRGKPGRQTLALKLARLEFMWTDPEHVGPTPPASDEVLAAWAAEPHPADKYANSPMGQRISAVIE